MDRKLLKVSVKIVKLTDQMISKSSHYIQKFDDPRIPKTPKLSNLTSYVCSNSPRMSTPKLGLILNSNWSNDKSRGQTLKKIWQSNILEKLIEQGIE